MNNSLSRYDFPMKVSEGITSTAKDIFLVFTSLQGIVSALQTGIKRSFLVKLLQLKLLFILVSVLCTLTNCENASRVTTYPAPKEEIPSPDFKVKVNGKDLFVYQARVSAIPHNQVWPGYQRPKYQTELASFAYFDISGPVSVEVTSDKAIRTVDIRPKSYQIQPLVSGSTISFDLDRPRKIAVEVNGTHHALHLFASAPDEHHPDLDDANVRYFGPGVHHAGIIKMKDNETVYIAGGAVVHGVIEARDVSSIKILGRGILDASTIGRFDARRMVGLYNCSDVQIEGIICRDSQAWTIVPDESENVSISDVKLIGLWRYNSDGIDIVNSENVKVNDCFIRAYDDNIAIKGLRHRNRSMDTEEKNVRNIEVSNCVLWGDWGRALEIGVETSADSVGHIVFKNCDIIHYVHFALDITNGHRAIVHDVTYENIRIEEPTIHNVRIAEKDYDPAEGYIGKIFVLVIRKTNRSDERGKIVRINYKDIFFEGQWTPKSMIYGYDDEHLVQDIILDNVCSNGRKITNIREANLMVNDYVENITFK